MGNARILKIYMKYDDSAATSLKLRGRLACFTAKASEIDSTGNPSYSSARSVGII
jgi:hypothetical protein